MSDIEVIGELDYLYWVLKNILKELDANLGLSPLEQLIDEATGYNEEIERKEKEHKSEIIKIMKRIIKLKKRGNLSVDDDMKILKKIKRLN